MPTTPEEQFKSEPTIEQAVVPTPEVLSFPHDILGKEYKLDGVSFTVLGIQPVFHDPQEEEIDLPLNIFIITDIQSQKVPVIPFQGGYASITKIRIGDEVISGYADVIKYILVTEQTPEGWMTNRALAQELEKSYRTIKKIADQHHTTHPDWFHDYKISGGQIYEHYSPELCAFIRNELNNQEKAPDKWKTKKKLSIELEVDKGTILGRANSYRQSHPEWFRDYRARNGKIHEHYSPELCAIIRNELNNQEKASQGWMTQGALAIELKSGRETIRHITDLYRQSHPEWFHEHIDARSRSREHCSPQLCDIIRQELKDRRS